MSEPKTVLTVGSFDILHSDHLNLLAECRNLVGKRGRVIVGVNTDAFVEKNKGRMPVVHQKDRYMTLKTNRYVDDVFLNEEPSLMTAVTEFLPTYLAIGSDWAFPRDYMTQIGMSFGDLFEWRVKLVFIPTLERIHSSDYRERLADPTRRERTETFDGQG